MDMCETLQTMQTMPSTFHVGAYGEGGEGRGKREKSGEWRVEEEHTREGVMTCWCRGRGGSMGEQSAGALCGGSAGCMRLTQVMITLCPVLSSSVLSSPPFPLSLQALRFTR